MSEIKIIRFNEWIDYTSRCKTIYTETLHACIREHTLCNKPWLGLGFNLQRFLHCWFILHLQIAVQLVVAESGARTGEV